MTLVLVIANWLQRVWCKGDCY